MSISQATVTHPNEYSDTCKPQSEATQETTKPSDDDLAARIYVLSRITDRILATTPNTNKAEIQRILQRRRAA